jgi:NADPH2:quinone reductase
MHAIRVSENGGPEVLEWTETAPPRSDGASLLVDLEAAGLNYIDTYHRSGLYPMELPFTLGLEGAGVVVEAPAGSGFSPGDRVAWCNAPGSYAEQVRVPLEAAARVPEGVGLDVAAAVMLQGITAHYLAISTFPLKEGDRCLVHAGAGGVGSLLIQIAKMRGAEVFTTTSTEAKAEIARSAGADHVIDYTSVDFGDAVEEIAGDRPLDVIYDGVGKATFDRGLSLLRPRGMMVTFGNSSGPVDPVSPLMLSQNGSLFLTRPMMFHYIATRQEFDRRTGDLFDWIAARDLEVLIGDRISMSDAAQAHRKLEGRQTTGKVLLIP